MTESSDPSTRSDTAVQINVPPFARQCYEAAETAWRASFEHPFLKGLLDGTLSKERFRFYQMQDARYLEAYADACSFISTKLDDPERKLWFIEGAKLALVVERELHEGYGKAMGYSAQDIANLEPSPNNLGYQNHILNAAQSGSALTAVAAITPCAWLYTDIGQSISDRAGEIPDDHPFKNWLLTYSDAVFVSYTNELLDHLEHLAGFFVAREQREEAIRAFVISTKYEWMFWDQAWNLQSWSDHAEPRFEMELN